MPVRSTARALSFSFAALATFTYATQPYVLDPPSQPQKPGIPLQYEIIGNSGVSAQQMFLGTENVVYIVDKTENNPLQVDGHPAWASEITLMPNNSVRPMNVVSNSFCAGGNYLGDGRLLNVGGNQAITTGGNTPSGENNPAPTGGAPYYDLDGGRAIRLLTPCSNASCNWIDDPANYMTTRRWYPTIETLPDGTAIIIGGDTLGGYVNSADQNNPTYEFWPSQGDPINLNILENTLPANLFPITFLLPSGQLLIQTNWATELLNYTSGVETPLANIPYAVRTYPASGATVMLPLTPANNYTATVLFCGGTNLQPDQWNPADWDIAAHPADNSCVRISPDVDTRWHRDATLPESRTMGNFLLLPDGTIFLVNGGRLGTAGYGTQDWTIQDSYADSPIMTPLVYTPGTGFGSAPTSSGSFSRADLGNTTIPRLYHSSAILLPDGSVFIAGSNPHPDYLVGKGIEYPTEYRTERFYPWYYAHTRPEPQGLLSSIGYGGSYFNVTLSAADLQYNATGLITTVKAIILRTGFSTHAMNMGQRLVELQTSWIVELDGSATLFVSQLPPNPNILVPGPAVIHIVVGGVPSVGRMIMVGSGTMGNQTIDYEVASLPSPTIVTPPPSSSSYPSNVRSAATRVGGGSLGAIGIALLVSFGASAALLVSSL